jgi:hypothetical protein
MIKLFAYSLLFVFVSFAAHAKVLGYYNSKAKTQESDAIAQIETKIDGINFVEWESDFNNSLTKTPEDCKGQKCQFKNKQALDSSFDF